MHAFAGDRPIVFFCFSNKDDLCDFVVFLCNSHSQINCPTQWKRICASLCNVLYTTTTDNFCFSHSEQQVILCTDIRSNFRYSACRRAKCPCAVLWLDSTVCCIS